MQTSEEGRKRVLITGSNRGIGRATFEYFVERGWNVLAHARKPMKGF